MRLLCGNDTVAVAMHVAMKNGQICFSLRKLLAISPAIQKIASDCGCDAVVHLGTEEKRGWKGRGWGRNRHCQVNVQAIVVTLNKLSRSEGLKRRPVDPAIGDPVRQDNQKIYDCNPHIQESPHPRAPKARSVKKVPEH